MPELRLHFNQMKNCVASWHQNDRMARVPRILQAVFKQGPVQVFIPVQKLPGTYVVLVDDAKRRAELADFLRTRRARLTPELVGLPPGFHRRTGLRREEVAALAGISETWYTWLERGSDVRPSARVLEKLAVTLRLDDEELAHLYACPPRPSTADIHGRDRQSRGPADAGQSDDESGIHMRATDERAGMERGGRRDFRVQHGVRRPPDRDLANLL